MNKCFLMGRLTKDPEVRYTQGGKVVGNFNLAVDEGFGENKTTMFMPIVVWGKTAEMCGNNLTKGRRIVIQGRIQIRNYEAKDGSGKRYVTEVVAEMIFFADDKKSSGTTSQQAPSGEPSAMDGFGSPVAFDESEVPF